MYIICPQVNKKTVLLFARLLQQDTDITDILETRINIKIECTNESK